MGAVAIVFLVVAAYLLACGWDNMRGHFQPTAPAAKRSKKQPLISVCLPARNEEKRIRPCLEGFLNQNHPNYEVLVLDDQSTDGTWKLLKEYSRKSSRFRLFKGKPLPPGWVGKPWACRQLAEQARGRWLLFTDADTWHHPDTLARALATAENSKADLLTFMTAQSTVTWMEVLVIPALCFNLISFYPQRFVLRSGNFFSQYVWANGQFLFFRRNAYERIGGHAAVKGRIDEDLTFGKIIVRRGLRLQLQNGSDLVTCRMYESAIDVWRGLSKIIYPSFQYSPLKALTAYVSAGLMTILPFILLPFVETQSLLFRSSLFLSAVQVALRIQQSRRFGFSLVSSLLHPLGQLLLIMMGLNSMRWYVFGRKGYWKGRSVSIPR